MFRLVFAVTALALALLLSGFQFSIPLPGRVPEDTAAPVIPAVIDARYAHIPELSEEPLPMLAMIEGQLYRCTGAERDVDGRCTTKDGELFQSVERCEQPFMDGQSNFGAPYAYQYGDEGDIDVEIDGRWLVFSPVEL